MVLQKLSDYSTEVSLLLLSIGKLTADMEKFHDADPDTFEDEVSFSLFSLSIDLLYNAESELEDALDRLKTATKLYESFKKNVN